MGTGNYICVTLLGGAPWGFTLREEEGDTYRPLLISQVEEGGRAFLAGVQEGDEVVSLNGNPSADLTLLRAFALIDTSINCLQLLLKRYRSNLPDNYELKEEYCGERDSSAEALKSTTLHIFSPKHRSQSPKELNISESQDKTYYGDLDSDIGFRKGHQLHAPSSGDQRGSGSVLKENDEEIRQCFSPGDVIELQLSLSKQTLDDVGSTSLGSARGIEGEPSNREALEKIHTNTTSHYVPCSVREPLGQHGVVLSSPSVLGQVEVILQQPAASGAGRGGPRISRSGGSQGKGEEGGGHHKGVPGSFTVSFEIPSEETTPAEELDSDSEGDRDKPNKHRPRHARLRRSESLSEKQVKEAKSKCKHIALLLTAAPPNPNNKGVLMFKKHRQRAKKYTLVSYGTGEDQPEYSDEEDEEEGDNQATHTVKFTLVAPSDSDVDKDFLTNAHSSKAVLAITLDKGLLDIEKNLNSQAEMECLPETKGKGALMFAKRRQRMDEISAEHEELRRQGIPVEGGHEAEKKTVEQSYMQSTTEGHAYMDVNIHQQSQHQQQYRQYQDQEYYEQQQNYQQQCQQQQYDQQHYQQQQRYPQQQEYQQQQQQQYSAAVNGTLQHQTSEMHTSFSNRTAKPFSVQNMVATPYSPAVSGTSQDSVGQGEQIASRDERISTPAIRSGLLMDARKRSTGKPMFTFKEAPKVSPNPELLNLVNRSEKKVGGESGTEEDYLSLGAEACNFLQSARFKHKTPPPVAPKPMINPSSPPWSTQMEMTNQDMPQHAENSVSTPAVAPTAETTPAPEPEPTPAPAPVPPPPPPPVPQGAPANTTTEEQHTWPLPEPESQHKPLQVTAQEESGHMNSTQQPEYVTTWPVAQTQAQQQPSANSWHSSHVQPQEPLPHTWTPQIQPSWSQSQGETQTQTPAQPSWAQPREPAQSEPQARSHWTHPHEQPHLQPIQSSWNQPEEPEQQPPQASWIQPSQTDTQHQPAWVQQPQQKSQAQPSWVQQPESTPQASWGQQPQYQAPQQAWPQAQALSQPQPSWISAQTQQQPQSSVNAWPPLQAQEQAQPQWIQTAQAQPQVQPQANLNTWAPGPSQAQSPPSWGGQHPEHGQHTRSSWAQEQNQTQQQTSWTPSVPPQSTAQPKLQPPTSQPKVNTWSPAQTTGNTWTPQPQQPPVNVSTLTVNPHPPPKSWHPSQHAPKTRTTPLQPQHLHSFTVGQRASSSINPMASVLIPSSSGSAYEMPAVRGKGADMFAKRQSRMEKFIVDSDTVQANRAGRPPSPAASLPNEWKYTSSAPGRSYSLSPPVRIPSTGQRSASFSPKPLAQVSTTPPGRQTSLEKGHKPLTPWEAASRHPLGLVDEAFTVQNFQQTLASNICLAAQRKLLPEPPVEWKPRVSHQAPKKTGSQTWSQSQSHSKSRAPLPSFMSPTKCTVSAVPDGYRSLPRQWQPQRPVTQEDLGSSVSSEHGRPLGKQTYKSVYTSNNWSWRR